MSAPHYPPGYRHAPPPRGPTLDMVQQPGEPAYFGGNDGGTVPPAPDSKPTNPKEAFGDVKVPLGVVPDSAEIFMALAFLEGALKYGSHNWAKAGVKVSTYNHAMKRHLKSFNSGEWFASDTGVPHLASIMACCAIILDANLRGKLNDDRPPVAPIAELLEAMKPSVAHLKELFADRDPEHITIHTEIPND